jgi:ribose-phosphate pyrophosphokinase
MYIFSGSASTDLGRKIALHQGGVFGDAEISKFTNGELKIRILSEHIGQQAIVVQSLSNPTEEHLMEFCLICDALTRMGVRDITAVVPWLGYSKQDKVFRPGEPLSVKIVAKILQTVPIKHLITFDLHNLAILGFFDIPVTNLSAKSVFVEHFQSKKTAKTVVVAPDAGSIKMSTAFAQDLDVPIVYMDKKRDLKTGEVIVLGISRPIEKADVVIIDDMIVTGSTLVETAKYLKKMNIRSLSVCATHHLYVPGAEEAIEKSGFDEVVVTDTIQSTIHTDRLTVVTVSDIAREELKKSVD